MDTSSSDDASHRSISEQQAFEVSLRALNGLHGAPGIHISESDRACH